MTDYIAFLGHMANEIHKQNNFDQNEKSEWVIKSQNENNVTRLLLHEFSLYTADKPLTADEFHYLITKIEELARNLQPNLYLVLGTVGVLNEKGRVNNNLIHVQCGPYPQIDVLTKRNPSTADPVYPDFPNSGADAIPATLTNPGTIYLPDKLLSSRNVAPAINYEKVVKCKTVGGAQFVEAFDICIDHLYEEGKKSYYKDKDLIMDSETTEPIPEQVTQVIASKKVQFKETSSVTSSKVRADACLSYRDTESPPFSPVDSVILQNVEDLPFVKKYDHLKSMTLGQFTRITNAPFGRDALISIYPAHQLGLVDDAMKSQIDEHHERIIEKILEDSINPPDITEKYSSHVDKKALPTNFVSQFFNKPKTTDEGTAEVDNEQSLNNHRDPKNT